MPISKRQPPRESLRIIELRVENIKRLKAISIKPVGDVVLIAGQNAQGKSSVLDAIAYALGGRDLCPVRPIRKGQKSGKVVVDLDKYKVERRFTYNADTDSTSSQIYVTSKDGALFRSPQTLLDDLVGDLTFDPAEFMMRKPDDQLKALQSLVGINFDDLNRERDQKFTERTVINRTVKALRANLVTLPNHADAPMKEIGLADLAEQLQNANAHNQGIQNARTQIADTVKKLSETVDALQMAEAAEVFLGDDDLNQIVRRGKDAGIEFSVRVSSTIYLQDEGVGSYVATPIEDMRTAIRAGIERLTIKRDGLISQKAAKESALETYIGENGDTIDTDAMVREHQESTDLNIKIRENRAYREKSDELTKKEGEAQALTDRLDEIEQTKRDRLAAVKMPVPGLSFTDEGVTFNGVPFEQASSAEQIRVSFGMAIEMNKDKALRICLIRTGAFLDDANLAVVEQMASESGCQVWIERVGGDGDATIIIEDGEVMKEAA